MKRLGGGDISSLFIRGEMRVLTLIRSNISVSNLESEKGKRGKRSTCSPNESCDSCKKCSRREVVLLVCEDTREYNFFQESRIVNTLWKNPPLKSCYLGRLLDGDGQAPGCNSQTIPGRFGKRFTILTGKTSPATPLQSRTWIRRHSWNC